MGEEEDSVAAGGARGGIVKQRHQLTPVRQQAFTSGRCWRNAKDALVLVAEINAAVHL